MADGRKVQYLIELMPDTKQFEKIRQKIKAIDGGEFIKFEPSEVKKLKGILQGVVDDVGNRASSIGTKIQQGIANGLDKDKLQKMLDIDTTKLRETMEIVEKLTGLIDDHSKGSSWLKDGKGFLGKLSGSQQDLRNLEQSIGKLELKFEGLDASLTSTIAKFDALANAIRSLQDNGKPVVVSPINVTTGTKQVQQFEKEISDLNALLTKLSGKDIEINTDNVAKDFHKLAREADKLSEKIDDLTYKADSPNTSKDDERNLRMQIANRQAQLAQMYREMDAMNQHYQKSHSDTSVSLFDDAGVIDDPKDIVKQAREYIESVIKELSVVTKSEAKKSDNAVGIEIALPSIDDIKKKLNDAIDQLNKPNALHKVKLEVDDSVVPIEGRLDKTANAIEKKLTGEKGILEKTKEWRKQMLEQFKFKSGDFEFKFNNNLIEELQTLFDEYGLKINIDPIYLADQIKTVLEGSSVSLGGGVANIDPSVMASAVMAGVRAALVGESLDINMPVTSVQKRIPDATENIATEIEQTANHLNIAEEYVQDVVKKIKEVAKYAVKPTDKDTNGTIATREQFKLLGLDLEAVKSAGDDDDAIAKMLNPLLKRGDFNKLIGSTVIDELSAFKGSSSNTISAFVESLREMFYMLQEDTETVDEWTRKKHSREIFDYARGRARAADSLRGVRSSIRADKIPDIEYIDKAITAMSAIGKDADGLKALRLAREKLGGNTDEQSIQEFNAVANDFYKSTTQVFYDLKKQAEDAFKGTVYLQGSKKSIVKKQDIESYKQLARLGDDDVILDIRVTSSLNNVALGTTKSKHKDRISPYEEKRLLDGKRGDYVVSPEYEKDILRRELEYGGFKPQGAPTIDVNLDATLEANTKKREALMAEIKANEEEKKLLREQIDAADKQIADLTIKNDAIPQGRKNATKKKIAEREALSAQLENEIFWLEERVGNGKDGDNKKIGSLTKEIEEQLSKRVSAERQLAELSELDVERRKKSLTNKITEIESKDIPGLQQDLEKAQIRYRTADSDKVLAQVEVLKAQSALKTIPKGKANDIARVEASERVAKANRELARATEVFESASKDIDDITSRIENNKRKIENLQNQVSETTLESIRQEQITRIQTINNAITSLEEEFAKTSAEKTTKEAELLRSNKSIERARNDVVSRTQRELDNAIATRNNLSARDRDLDTSTQKNQDEVYRLELLSQRVEAEKAYNTLQEKSLMLQGSIKKMAEDEVAEDALSDKRTELEKINAELAESIAKVQSLGGFIAQREVREYTDAERKAYALEQIQKIDDDLITARAQKNVVAARMAKKDQEIAEVDRWGLGAGIGARTLNQEKYKATSEFMNSDYVRSLIDEAKEQTKVAIAKAIQKSELAETNMTNEFNDRVANAMIRDGLNPYSNEQTQQFLQTERGKQYSQDHNVAIESIKRELEETTRSMWSLYDERVRTIRTQVSAEFKEGMKVDNGVLSYVSKIRDESGEWINELVEVYVRDSLRKRLVDAKEILEEEQTPIQTNIDRLYADRKTAIEYGGVGKKEILSADVIEDQISKQTELDKLLDKRVDKEKDLKDLEVSGVQDSDDSVKRVKKEIEELDKKIARYEMLIRNRKKLVEMRWDESKADGYTSEEKELHFTDQIVNYNQKIETSLAKQEELKKKIESASVEEKTNLQYQLAKEEEKVAGWRKSIKGYEGGLQKIETTKSEVASVQTSASSSGLIGAIKESLANSGGASDEILNAISETVSKILEVITSGGVKISADSKTTAKGSTKDVALEKKLSRIRVLEAEKAASVNKSTWTSAMSEEERKASIATVNKYNKDTVNKWKGMGADELINVMQDITRSMDGLNKESVEYLAKQRELGRVLNVYKNKSPATSEATVTKKNGNSYINSKILAEKDEALKQLGLYDKYDPITSDLAVRNMFAAPKAEGFTQKKEEELARLKQEIKELNATAKDNGGLKDAIPEETAEETDELTAKIERLKQKFEEAKKVGYLDKNDADLKAFESATDKNEALRYGDKVSAKVSKNRRAYSGTTEMNAVARQRDNMDARGILENDDLDSVKAYNKAYSDLIAKHKEFSTAGTLYDPENQKTIQKMAINVKALGKELEAAQTRSEDLQQKVANSGLYNGKSIGDISQVDQNVDIYEQMRAKLEELGATHIKIDRIRQTATGTIRHNDRLVSDLEVSYDKLTGSLARYHKQERESLTGVPAFINGFQKKFNSIMQYLSMTMSIHRIISEVRKGIQYIREIDKALTELKKVTDETEETYDRFLQTAAKTGARLGSTIAAVTEATATFAKLGYSMQQASEMAEAAIVYKNVGDGIASTEDAANSIISTLKGFRLEASESMAIVDKFNEVGNNFAITSQGIGEALRLSASALNEGKNSLDESIALITAANEVVNDPSSVGTALKTLTLRLRGSKTELEEMGEDVSDMATTTSQLQAKLLALTGGKVDIMLDENTFKNSTQILREMASAWEDMDDISRASALELMGGKRQANTLSALIQNFETAEKVIEASANSSGSALKENERYLDSIQGKIDQFTNATQAMWSNFLEADVVKGIVEIGTWIIKVIDKIGVLNTALITLATISMVKNKMGPIEFFGSISNMIRDIPGKIGGLAKRLTGVATATSTLTSATLEQAVANGTITTSEAIRQATTNGLILSQVTLTDAEAMAALSTTALNEAEKQAIINKLGLSSAATTLTIATLGQAVAEGKITAAEATHLGVTTGLMTAQASLTATKAADILTSQGLSVAHAEELTAKLGLTSATTTLNAAKIQQLTIDGILTPAESALALSLLATGGAATTAATGFAALWTAMWPILAIMGAFMAISFIVKNFDKWTRSAKYLREELSNLKTEISDVQSEIDSLNGELETTQERMAELLAQDSLTFTEQEELENLQKQNDLLEREIYLLEQREKRLQKEAQNTFDELMDKETKDEDRDGDGEDDVYDKKLEKRIGKYESAMTAYEEAKRALVEAEKNGDEKEIKKAEKQVEKAEKKLDKQQSKVDEKLNQYIEDADGIDYESADAQTRKYLDYIYNTEGRYNILSGEKQAKSVEIKRIFNKSTMSGAKDEIDKLVKKLAKNPGDKNIIAQISEQCKLAENDLKAVGLSVQDATDYFAKLGTANAFNTLDGKVAEMSSATSRLQTLLSNTKSAEFANLFDKDGEVLETAIAEYFQGTSEKTRKEIARLVKDINDGEISVENALKQFELFSIESSLDIYITEVQTNFKDVFTDLEEADGLIDTFEELGEAIGSTSNALKAFNQAEAEMTKSGRVSIETALQLMEYTDDYGSILQVVDGKLQLVDNAEEVLIQTRIDAIKTSAQASLTDAQNAYEKAKLATQTYRTALETDVSASVVASAWEKTLAAGAGLLAGIKSLITDETWTEAYNRVYNETLSGLTGYETSYDDAGLQALVEAEEDAKKALDAASDRVELVNQLTPETLESMYDADDVDSKEDVADEAFQKEMDYWENRIAANQAKYEQLQNEIDLLEAKGQKADASFYEEQIKLEGQRLELLNSQKAVAQEHLATLEEGSEEWWEVANTLNDIESELDDVTASIVDLQDAIAEIDTYKFEEFNTRLDNLVSKLETIRNLIAPDSEEDWFDDEGNWTEEGVAVLGSYLQELETYKQGYADTVEELNKYAASYNGNEAYYETLGIHSEQEYYDKTEELISQQYEFAESISDTEQSVVDMYESSIDAVEEYIETLIDGYNDYIDSVKEALDAERDLYDFKKNVQKQAKDIAAIERRIASLSGSTNAADIAERRKLEAQLYESRESLNDTYYDHAQNAQSEALDKEAEAYETSMNNMIEGLRTSLEEATSDMDEFLMGVTSMVMYNADTVLSKYEETNLPLTKELTNPWEEAKKAVGNYSGNALDLMNQWTKEGGFFAQFNASGTTNLQSPWRAGTTAANSFKTSVSTVMSGVVSNIATNVKTASGELSKLYQQIKDTEARAASANVTVSNPSAGTPSGSSATAKKYYVTAFLDMGSRSLSVTKSANTSSEAMSAAKIAIAGEYEKVKGNSVSAESAWLKTWRDRVKYTTQYYAKGTTGITENQLAIIDELGPELIMHANPKTGRLEYLTKGSSVIPHDATTELMKLADIGVDGLMMPKLDSGVNMMANYITKPEFKIDIEEFVHVDKVDQDTLPKLEAMMDKKINDFGKALNYSIKRFAR